MPNINIKSKELTLLTKHSIQFNCTSQENGFEAFTELSPVEKKVLNGGTIKRKALKKEVIYRQNDHNRYIYYLVSGCVKTGIHYHTPYEVITGIVCAGQFWNMQGLIDEETNDEYAKVLGTEACYLKIQTETVMELMKYNFAFYKTILNSIGHNLKRMEHKISLLHYHKNVKQRLIDFLLALAEDFGVKVGYEILIEHNFSYQDLADFIFSMQQSVTRAINELREEGLIDYDKDRILIRDLECLKIKLRFNDKT